MSRLTAYLPRPIQRKKRLRPELADQYKFICQNVAFDYSDSEKQTEYMIALCILRFRVSEDVYENIITNLPPEEFPADEIKHLYHFRWGNRDIFPWIEARDWDIKLSFQETRVHRNGSLGTASSVQLLFHHYRACANQPQRPETSASGKLFCGVQSLPLFPALSQRRTPAKHRRPNRKEYPFYQALPEICTSAQVPDSRQLYISICVKLSNTTLII